MPFTFSHAARLAATSNGKRYPVGFFAGSCGRFLGEHVDVLFRFFRERCVARELQKQLLPGCADTEIIAAAEEASVGLQELERIGTMASMFFHRRKPSTTATPICPSSNAAAAFAIAAADYTSP